jgi:Site-specific recombinase XerD
MAGVKKKRGTARACGQNLKGFRYDEARGLAHFSVYIPGGGGEDRRRATVEAATVEEAVEKWTDFRARALRGEERPAKTLTFREYVAAYMEDIEDQVSTKTAEEYRRTTLKHLLPEFGSKRLQAITTAMVKSFELKLKRKGYALATVNGYINVLLILLHRAVDDFEVLDEFPLKKRLKRKKPAPLALELTDAERTRFFAVFDDEARYRADLAERRTLGEVRTCERYPEARRFGASLRPDGDAAADAFARFRFLKPLFVVAIETGLRKGDLLRLSWRAVDFEQRWVSIIMQKTKLPVTVPLSEACHAALQECRDRGFRSECVFTDEDGLFLSATRVHRTFARAKRLAGIERRFRFHDLRHSFASKLASHNVHLGVISKAMGHTTIAMTMRYARPSQEALRDITRALDS